MMMLFDVGRNPNMNNMKIIFKEPLEKSNEMVVQRILK